MFVKTSASFGPKRSWLGEAGADQDIGDCYAKIQTCRNKVLSAAVINTRSWSYTIIRWINFPWVFWDFGLSLE